jgi:hypothetical protein
MKKRKGSPIFNDVWNTGRIYEELKIAPSINIRRKEMKGNFQIVGESLC